MGLSKVPLHNVGLDAAAEALLSGRYSNLNDAIDNCSSLKAVERPDAHTTRTHIVHGIDATYTNENGLVGVDDTALFRLIIPYIDKTLSLVLDLQGGGIFLPWIKPCL